MVTVFLIIMRIQRQYSTKVTSHFSPLASHLWPDPGDWQAGKQTGIGKFFYLSGAVKFHGNLTDSLAEGRGCFYYEDGSLMFDGDFKQGKFHRGKLLTPGKYLVDKGTRQSRK